MLDLSSPLASVAATLADSALAAPSFPWNLQVFEKTTWERLMNFLRIALPLFAAALLLLELAWEKLGGRGHLRARRGVAVLLSALAFGSYFDFGNPNTRYDEYVHRHEFFHYYLGSKYFEELGYKRIYECTAAAEMELGRGAAVRSREMRDLRVNLIKKNSEPDVQAHIEECRQIFAQNPQRWNDFKQDVDWFYRFSAGSYWDNMQKDHGYNPPPVWTMAGKLFSSLGSADLDFFKALAGIDILLHIGIVALLWWAFGWRVGAVATIWWGCNYPANFYWTGGAFMRQDWFFFLTAAVCLARKRWFELAGAALVWAALLRVFPMLLFAGVGMIIAVRFVMKLRSGTPLLQAMHSDHRRFLGGCIVALGTLVPLSMVTTTGPKAYQEFFQHTLGTHNHTPLTNHMGLKTLMVHDWEGRMRFTRDDNLDDPFSIWKAGRTERAESQKHLRHAIVLGLGLWMLWALRRERLLWIGMGMSLPLAMSLVELTCYYFSMFIVGAVMAKARREYGAIVLLFSGASQLIGSNIHNRFYFIDDKFAALSWLFLAQCVMMLIVFSRPFSVSRLKNWWGGLPDVLPQRRRARPAPPAEPVSAESP